MRRVKRKEKTEDAEYAVFYFGVSLGMVGVVAFILDLMGLI